MAYVDVNGNNVTPPDPIHVIVRDGDYKVKEIIVNKGDDDYPKALEWYVFTHALTSKRKIVITKGGPGSGHHGHAGRPGKIGGSAPSGLHAAKVAGHGEIRLGYDGNLGVDSMLDDSLQYGGGWLNANDLDRSNVKARNVRILSERTGINEYVINKTIKYWALTSNDNSLQALEMQETAAEVLGLELGDWQKGKLNEMSQLADNSSDWFESRVRNAMMDVEEIEHEWDKAAKAADARDEYTKFMEEHRQEYAVKHNEALNILTKMETERDRHYAGNYKHSPMTYEQRTSFIREMYNWTQNDLQTLGYLSPNDQVTLFRGINRDYLDYQKNDVVSYRGNAIESWSLSDRSAADFAFGKQSGTGIVMAITVPRRNIISTAVTGLGCLSEGEVIISGTIPGHKVRIYDIMQFDEVYSD